MESLTNESYGKYLKKVRIEKGYSIENICFETKISRYIIEQIELENRENLPEDVFLKGFLKSYAEVLGLAPAKVLKLYLGSEDETVEEEAEPLDVPEKRSLNRCLIVGAIAGIALVCAVLYIFFVQQKPEEPVVESAPVVQGEVQEADAPKEAEASETNMVLDVLCIEETTLKVSVDGNIPVEYAMKPEERIQIKARDNYNILIDNNCGVSLFMGDKTVNVPGKCGQVVNLRLP